MLRLGKEDSETKVFRQKKICTFKGFQGSQTSERPAKIKSNPGEVFKGKKNPSVLAGLLSLHYPVVVEEQRLSHMIIPSSKVLTYGPTSAL